MWEVKKYIQLPNSRTGGKYGDPRHKYSRTEREFLFKKNVIIEVKNLDKQEKILTVYQAKKVYYSPPFPLFPNTFSN